LKTLPNPCTHIQDLLNPSGVLDIIHTRQPSESDPTVGVHKVEVRPRSVAMRCKPFPYPVHDVTGVVTVWSGPHFTQAPPAL